MVYIEEFAELFQPLSFAGVLFLVWAASFIVLPLIRRKWGATGERIGTSAGVVASVILAAGLLAPTHGVWTLAVCLGVPFLGWLSEFIGWKTGFPFGAYHYTDKLKPQVGHVPVIIPLAWLMLMPASWAVAVAIAPESTLLQCVVAAGAFTAWDLFVDPQMVTSGYWVWDRKGPYMGIPLVNFAGWFAVSFLITGAFSLGSLLAGFDMLAAVSRGPFLVMFAMTWVLQTMGHLTFWKLRTSAAAGFVGMGIFVLLVALRAA